MSEQVGLEVTFESVHSTAGSNVRWQWVPGARGPATDKTLRASSLRVHGKVSSGASDDRRGRTTFVLRPRKSEDAEAMVRDRGVNGYGRLRRWVDAEVLVRAVLLLMMLIPSGGCCCCGGGGSTVERCHWDGTPDGQPSVSRLGASISSATAADVRRRRGRAAWLALIDVIRWSSAADTDHVRLSVLTPCGRGGVESTCSPVARAQQRDQLAGGEASDRRAVPSRQLPGPPRARRGTPLSVHATGRRLPRHRVSVIPFYTVSQKNNTLDFWS